MSDNLGLFWLCIISAETSTNLAGIEKLTTFFNLVLNRCGYIAIHCR